MDIAASVAPNSVCMFRSPMASPTHSPLMKRRSETGPAAFRHAHPDGMPPRRVSSVDVMSVNERLELLKEEGNNNKKRRTTVHGTCPIFKSKSISRDQSIEENEDDDDDEGRLDLNGDASLIGMDEESLEELVELTQHIDSILWICQICWNCLTAWLLPRETKVKPDLFVSFLQKGAWNWSWYVL